VQHPRKIKLFDTLAEFFQHLLGLVLIGRLQQHDKFLASETEQQIVAAKTFAHDP
jgi:hypothetical protein